MGLSASVFCTAMLAIAAAAPADTASDAPAADDPLSEGIALYHAFEFEQAVFRFQRASIAPRAAAPQRAMALVWLGMTQASVGDLDAAARSFDDALHLDSSSTLPEDVSPKVAELFAQAQARAASGSSAAPAPGTPAPASTDAAPSGPSGLMVGGIVSALGAVGVVSAGALLAVAFQRVSFAEQPDTFQDDAKAAVDTANGLAAGSAALAAVGVAALISGGVIVLVSPQEQ